MAQLRYDIYQGVRKAKTKLAIGFSALGLLLGGGGLSLLPSIAAHADPVCTETGFFRDGINLTAARIGGDVTGPLEATGCDIGVYYGPTSNNTVNEAEIFGARYFGVVNRGGDVDVTDSEIHNIGDTPFSGAQHGVGINFASVTTGDSTNRSICDSTITTTGTVSGNDVYEYQKGGIVVSCDGASVDIQNNTVTGLGPFKFIAQNGIQVGFGAIAVGVSGNTVTANIYTAGAAKPFVSTGVLFFSGTLQGVDSNKVLPTIQRTNDVHQNQANVTVIN
ncbi:hypothetical protein HY379_00675 [Candidatus Saccharibacteria bacterium]|nr:hypothetical protein [Candidatus Saccharibacteria bacterium]